MLAQIFLPLFLLIAALHTCVLSFFHFASLSLSCNILTPDRRFFAPLHLTIHSSLYHLFFAKTLFFFCMIADSGFPSKKGHFSTFCYLFRNPMHITHTSFHLFSSDSALKFLPTLSLAIVCIFFLLLFKITCPHLMHQQSPASLAMWNVCAILLLPTASFSLYFWKGYVYIDIDICISTHICSCICDPFDTSVSEAVIFSLLLSTPFIFVSLGIQGAQHARPIRTTDVIKMHTHTHI